MVNLLRKAFIKNYNEVKNPKVRQAHGKMASFVGVFSNLFLFAIKLIAGLLSGSIAIIADSINNLSDMGSSIVTLIGFKLSSMPADDEHPYGHERMEYIAGLIVSVIVLIVGGSLFITSIEKIIQFTPEEVENTILYISIGILSVSILVKLWQSLFNKKVGKIIDSVALEATAADSRNDCIATGTILIGNIVMLFVKNIPFSLDGILGVAVSLFICYSGIKLIKETTEPLIGVSSDREFVDNVLTYVKSNEVVLGVHDVVCHMYGPTTCFMTLHAEVDSKGDIIAIHDAIDSIEKYVRDNLNVELTIHMDPLVVGDPEIDALKDEMAQIIAELDPELQFHDFRMVRKLRKSTILFDIVVPYKYKMTHEEITAYLADKINQGKKKYALLIEFDHRFIKK